MIKRNSFVKKRRLINSDKVFDAFNLCVMLLLLVIFVYPLWFVIIASFSEPKLVMTGQVLFWPKNVTLKSYTAMLEFKRIWTGYANTIVVTVAGTVAGLFMSVCMAYPLSVKGFMPRKIILYMALITMHFSGGLIPTYLVVKNLGMINTRWALIIPGAMSVYNSFVVRSYFENSIPNELYEASKLDGANSFQYLIKVVLPLSKPVLAVVGLYYMVSNWNEYTPSLYYIYDEKKAPLQSVLKDLLMSTQIMLDEIMDVDPEMLQEAMELVNTLKYSVIIAGVLPMLVVYPFIQKFFVKGIMVGSMKG